MNKKDLVAQVVQSTGLSREDASKAVDAVLESVTGALNRGEEVRLVGFGTFSVARRTARVGRNPRTGESIDVRPGRSVRFKAGKTLRLMAGPHGGGTDDDE
ncbi:DNA-binding protein HU-beta [Hephaestia caeni]|uniref:DNA-binding protein HU-beta n=1 Tax=Hephaestia caeni TaxID=645617 RepID=A0A397PCW5_9SPHN|nr:HU family DNA-binding protein [Hephaestia caeni]RIA46253.1 DNA-binding protein HU-beta [Hephaestia caeni]